MTEQDAQERAANLKERVYVAFTSLAVVITLRTHEGDVAAGLALATLAITIGGTVLAVFLADFLSHLTVHGRMPERDEFRRMLAASLGAFTVAVAPALCIVLAVAGILPIAVALWVAMLLLVLTLTTVGYLAVRRTSLRPLQKVVVLAVATVLGIVVIALDLLAHL